MLVLAVTVAGLPRHEDDLFRGLFRVRIDDGPGDRHRTGDQDQANQARATRHRSVSLAVLSKYDGTSRTHRPTRPPRIPASVPPRHDSPGQPATPWSDRRNGPQKAASLRGPGDGEGVVIRTRRVEESQRLIGAALVPSRIGRVRLKGGGDCAATGRIVPDQAASERPSDAQQGRASSGVGCRGGRDGDGGGDRGGVGPGADEEGGGSRREGPGPEGRAADRRRGAAEGCPQGGGRPPGRRCRRPEEGRRRGGPGRRAPVAILCYVPANRHRRRLPRRGVLPRAAVPTPPC